MIAGLQVGGLSRFRPAPCNTSSCWTRASVTMRLSSDSTTISLPEIRRSMPVMVVTGPPDCSASSWCCFRARERGSKNHLVDTDPGRDIDREDIDRRGTAPQVLTGKADLAEGRARDQKSRDQKQTRPINHSSIVYDSAPPVIRRKIRAIGVMKHQSAHARFRIHHHALGQ